MKPKRPTGACCGKAYRIDVLQVPITPIAELDNDAWLMCPRRTIPLMMPENLTGECAECGASIQWHPSSPQTVKRVCRPCVEAHTGDKNLCMTDVQAAFIKAHEARRRH